MNNTIYDEKDWNKQPNIVPVDIVVGTTGFLLKYSYGGGISNPLYLGLMVYENATVRANLRNIDNGHFNGYGEKYSDGLTVLGNVEQDSTTGITKTTNLPTFSPTKGCHVYLSAKQFCEIKFDYNISFTGSIAGIGVWPEGNTISFNHIFTVDTNTTHLIKLIQPGVYAEYFFSSGILYLIRFLIFYDDSVPLNGFGNRFFYNAEDIIGEYGGTLNTIYSILGDPSGGIISPTLRNSNTIATWYRRIRRTTGDDSANQNVIIQWDNIYLPNDNRYIDVRVRYASYNSVTNTLYATVYWKYSTSSTWNLINSANVGYTSNPTLDSNGLFLKDKETITYTLYGNPFYISTDYALPQFIQAEAWTEGVWDIPNFSASQYTEYITFNQSDIEWSPATGHGKIVPSFNGLAGYYPHKGNITFEFGGLTPETGSPYQIGTSPTLPSYSTNVLIQECYDLKWNGNISYSGIVAGNLSCRIYLEPINDESSAIASGTINTSSLGAFDCTDRLTTVGIDTQGNDVEIDVVAQKDLVEW